ncbi:MAG: hypothetical protein R3195_11075 [Gemmatimonadota bacterium]|nr:hypothetical protein [Gemmatimonadota bacterium]
MTRRLPLHAATLFVAAASLTWAACGSDPTGVPYRQLGREMAGVYSAQPPTAENKDLRLVLGTTFNVSGRYESLSGEIARFYGTWERAGNTLLVTLDPTPGLPGTIELAITREKIYTEYVDNNPFSMRPENAPPLFTEQDIMRLRGMVLVEGTPVEVNLTRIITDLVEGGDGGQVTN